MPAEASASLPHALSPEARLILLSAGGPANDSAIRSLALGQIDWGKLCWLAESEKATEVLWRRCTPAFGKNVPEGAAPLQRLALISDFRAHQAQQRLGEAIELLGRTGVDVLLLKGAALATAVYRSFTERPMSDLDLLIPAQRATGAYDLLLRNGWKPVHVAGTPTKYDSHQHLAPLVDGRGTGVRLELHTGLFFEGHPFRLTTESFWSSARPVMVGTRSVFVPDPNRLLLHTALHYAWSHMLEFGTWRAFRDVHAIVAMGIDWDEFTRLALQSRGGTAVYWTLRMARALSGFPAPPAVLDRLRPRSPELILRRIEQHFAHMVFRTETTCPSVRLGRIVWETAFEPRRSGHGTVRPWDHDHDFASGGGRGADTSRRFGEEWRKWARYGRAVVLTTGSKQAR
jgi:hypothetical protein